MSTKETIHFILTGGTIDSYYEGTKDTVVPHATSVVPQFIKDFVVYSETEFTQICMKDSRSLNEDDLKTILKTVEESPHNQIIITHGTYTMPDTGRFLKAQLKRNDQTIVLTGSMIPMSGFTPSDGPFNLGFAIAQVQILDPGIYVCMNATVFNPEEVSKLISEGRFISIFGEKT